MANTKKTLYEILEVEPNASLPEIQAAHRRLCQKLLLRKPALSREEIDFNLKVIDMALQTLSDQASRDAYDARLSPPRMPANAVVPVADASSLKIAAAIAANQKIAGVLDSSVPSPLKVLSATTVSSVSALKILFRFLAGLLALGLVVKCSTMVTASRQPDHGAAGVSKAEEKVIIQEYYQTHGVRPGSKAEADLLEIENRRKENEEREAAREKQKEEESYRRFVQESIREGNEVTANLHRAEERARREEEQSKQRLERENRMKEQAYERQERIRLEKARKRVGLPPSTEEE